MSLPIPQTYMVTDEHGTAAPAETVPRWIGTRSRFFAVLATWFAGQVALRCLLSPTVDLDESEQLVFTQAFQWGYSPQPPLYTWLQMLFFQVFTPSIFALALFKNFLLFITYAGVYTAARAIVRSHAGGTLAALSLLFIPQYAWEAQRSLTHSVLATAVAAVTLTVALRLIEKPSLGWYTALGTCVGVGLLSNYTYAQFAGPLLIGALLTRELRGMILNRRIFAALVIVALVLWPHISWSLQNVELVLSSTRKLRIQPDAAWWFLVFAPVARIAGSFVTHIASILLVFLAMAWKQVIPLRRDPVQQPIVRWLLIAFLSAPACALVVMLATHSTVFKGRWLQPAYLLLPLVITAWINPRLTRAAMRRLVGTACAIGVLLAFLLPARLWVSGQQQHSTPLNISFAQLGTVIKPQVDRVDLILADGKLTGGNLRLLFPDKTILTPQFSPAAPMHSATQCVFVFDETLRDRQLFQEMIQLAARFSADTLDTNVTYVDVPMRFSPGNPRRYGVGLLRGKLTN